MANVRVGMIVPSSNVTMEIELPPMIRSSGNGGSFSFHSSRMAMRTVSPEELKAMDEAAGRCVNELLDARCDVLAYACLVAVMVQGSGAHRDVESRLGAVANERGVTVPIVSSAGAMVDTLQRLGASRVAMVAPYVPELTAAVRRYLEAEGIAVLSEQSLGIADNHEVGCIPGDQVIEAARGLDLRGADVLLLSACVQMPSLALIDRVERALEVPVVTAASATAAATLHAVGFDPTGVPGAAAGAWGG